jgi:hypothetical protein
MKRPCESERGILEVTTSPLTAYKHPTGHLAVNRPEEAVIDRTAHKINLRTTGLMTAMHNFFGYKLEVDLSFGIRLRRAVNCREYLAENR